VLPLERSLSGSLLYGPARCENLVLNDAPAKVKNKLQNCSFLKVSRAKRHNLKNLTVEIPLGRLVCITGVSGSGKTTLMREVLLPALSTALKSASPAVKASERMPGERNGEENENHSSEETRAAVSDSALIEGYQSLRRVILVDQSILGKTPRSNPAVYIGAFDDIREVFAQCELARQRGLKASAFSFNSSQGQCERCRGAGFEKIEMQFLSDIFIRCPDCDCHRYRAHILEVKLERQKATDRVQGPGAGRPMSIADLLESTVEEAVEFLSSFGESKPAQRAVHSLELLQEVGLGYLKLGQPINTLSGGESQRLKLVRHLAEILGSKNDEPRPAADREQASRLREQSAKREAQGSELPNGFTEREAALFLFDEPTTGLHFDDVRVLLKVFQRLVNAGHSLVVVEHNLEVIKSADWLIDLGPDAGDEGGLIVAQGTPEQVAECEQSHTGRALREVLEATNLSCNSTALSKTASESIC